MKRMILAIALAAIMPANIASANRSNATISAIMGQGARTVAVYDTDDGDVGDRFISKLPAAGVKVGDRTQVQQ